MDEVHQIVYTGDSSAIDTDSDAASATDSDHSIDHQLEPSFPVTQFVNASPSSSASTSESMTWMSVSTSGRKPVNEDHNDENDDKDVDDADTAMKAAEEEEQKLSRRSTSLEALDAKIHAAFSSAARPQSPLGRQVYFSNNSNNSNNTEWLTIGPRSFTRMDELDKRTNG